MELGSEQSEKAPKTKFGKYLAKGKLVKKQQVDYCRLYETLDRDIRGFNQELEFYNKQNKNMFDRLVQSIEKLITDKFPGKRDGRSASGHLRELQNGAGDAVVGHRLGTPAGARELFPRRRAHAYLRTDE